MTKTTILNSKQQALYKKLLGQISQQAYFGPITLMAVEFKYVDNIVEYENEPVEGIQISWHYSFEKTSGGFQSNVSIQSRIQSDYDPLERIYLEAVYKIDYFSELELPDYLVDKFAHEKVLPQVWPYFRQLAKDLYIKAGLLWTIIPIEPKVDGE